jgi:hypothetical protein
MSALGKTGFRFAVTAFMAVAGSSALAQSAPQVAPHASAAVSPAETVLSRVLFERQEVLNCTGTNGCISPFLTVAAKHRYELQQTSCFVTTGVTTTVTLVSASFNQSPGDFIMPISLGFQVTANGRTQSTFQQTTSMFVPAGKVLTMSVGFSGPAPTLAACQVFGQIVTLK